MNTCRARRTSLMKLRAVPPAVSNSKSTVAVHNMSLCSRAVCQQGKCVATVPTSSRYTNHKYHMDFKASNHMFREDLCLICIM